MTTTTPGRLQDAVALITGGGSGIGRAVAERFLAEGAKVAVLGREQEKLDEVVSASAAPERMVGIAADVTSSAEMHRAVDRTVETFGALDVLVPNAGIWDYNRAVTRLGGQELSEAFDELFAVNVKGYLLAVEAAWRPLVASRGNVVMTLSNASFYAAGGGPVYTASKFACRGLVTQLAYELAPKVRVNGVAVGGMRTDLRGPGSIGLQERSIADSFDRGPEGPNPLLPLHEASTDPKDYTGPYVMLASPADSSTVTGTIIQADGGIGVRGFRTAAGGDDL